MNLSINSIASYNKASNPRYTINYSHSNNLKNAISFYGLNTNKALKSTSYSMMAGILAVLFSCTNPPKQQVSNDTTEITSEIEKQDCKDSVVTELQNKKKVETYYHYLPSEEEVKSTDYSWVEKLYPDGSVEIDSMEYKIFTTPDGKKTISYKETNEDGKTTIMTTYPDGSNGIRTEKDKSYTDTIYWQNGNIKQIQNLEVEINTPDNKSIKSKILKHYDENGILLYWENFDSEINIEQLKENAQYDELGRLLDDGIYKYEYSKNNNSEIPIRYICEFEGCKLITELDEYGAEQNKYFEASNGVITPYSELDNINWE